MKKTLIMTIVASSMMSAPAFAWDLCEQLNFRTADRLIKYEHVSCRHGRAYRLDEKTVLLVEPPEGGLINCTIPVGTIYGELEGIDVYHVTKLACDHPNPEFSNKLNINHNGVVGFWLNRDEIVNAFRATKGTWEFSSIWVK